MFDSEGISKELKSNEFSNISDSSEKFLVLNESKCIKRAEEIAKYLKNDCVILCRGLSPVEADELMAAVSLIYGLSDELDLQANFASSLGHRKNSGKYYMSVNNRNDYEFIPPHSEGSSFNNMQIASFYCYENTTDGGETILFNVNQESDSWGDLRELKKRVKLMRELSGHEIALARLKLRVDLPEDILKDEDLILQEYNLNIPGVKIYDVLAKVKTTYSKILNQNVYAFWDSVASIDTDSVVGFYNYLDASGLVKAPSVGFQIGSLDNASDQRIWASGVSHDDIFDGRITHKLIAGDFVIMNNLTWAHSVNNWTPEKGIRHVVAAFA